MLIHLLVFGAGLWLARLLCSPPLFTPRERRVVVLAVLAAAPAAGGLWWLVPLTLAGSVVVVRCGQT